MKNPETHADIPHVGGRRYSIQMPMGAVGGSLLINKPVSSANKRQVNRRFGQCLQVPLFLSTPKIRLVMVTMCIINFVSSLAYFGVNLNGANYSNDPFMYLILAALMEVPGYFFSGAILDRWGRKIPLITGYAITGVIITVMAFIPAEVEWLVMTLVLVGKIFLSGSFMGVFVYQAELLPTEVRVQGMSLTYMCMNLAASIAPYLIAFLGNVMPWLPSVVFGVSGLVACAALLPLPETHHTALPDTIDDLDKLWRTKKKRQTM